VRPNDLDRHSIKLEEAFFTKEHAVLEELEKTVS
jgi:hypothetical protein